MFNWFSNKKDDEVSEEPKTTNDYITPPEKPAHTFYRLGLTDNNRVSFSMGYSEITMNRTGIDSLIQQLTVFRDQLNEECEEECEEEDDK